MLRTRPSSTAYCVQEEELSEAVKAKVDASGRGRLQVEVGPNI